MYSENPGNTRKELRMHCGDTMNSKKTANDRPIAVNKRASHDYFIDQRI